MNGEESAKSLEFEEYFKQKLQEDKEVLKDLPYPIDEIRNMYKQEYDFLKNMPALELKMESQKVNHEIADYYLPEKWEMPREGKLLYSDQELQRVLKLLIFNLGIEKSLNVIPRAMIEQYLNTK